MRLTAQRAKIIDYLRAYGPMTTEDMISRMGGVDRDQKRIIRRLEKAGCVSVRDDTIRLLPPGYILAGSFPAKVHR